MRAILDHLIIRQTPAPEQSGLIALASQPQPDTGTVLAAGPKVRGIAVGDLVQFAPTTGQLMQDGNERFLAMREDDILVVLES